MNMVFFRVKNFGPITSGYEGREDDDYMEVPKVTLFCGPQGSGKSTLTKVLSALMWLEKAAQFIGWNRPETIFESDAIIKNLLFWHGMSTYFKESTEIGYRGSYLSLEYANGQLKMGANSAGGYSKPKIMYVPAERNMIHLLGPGVTSEMLPKPLAIMYAEFKDAQRKVRSNPYVLPVNGYRYVYDDSSQGYYIENVHSAGESSLTPVPEASSGLQSVLPLLLVTDYLSGKLGTEERSNGASMVLTANPFVSLGEDRKTLFQVGSQEKVDLGSILLGTLTAVGNFTNIVEEPEQNLFPPTQRNVLRHLLAVCQENPDNRLIVSTHSPYVVADVVAATKAHRIYRASEEKGAAREIVEMLEKCYARVSCVDGSAVKLYETNYDGTVSVPDGRDSGIPDTNFLNRHLYLGNLLFDELSNIEGRINGAATVARTN